MEMEGKISVTSKCSEVGRIKDRIASLVDQRFTGGGDTYYLSLLGNDLGLDRHVLERLTGQKLSEFIQSEFDFEIGRTLRLGMGVDALHFGLEPAIVLLE